MLEEDPVSNLIGSSQVLCMDDENMYLIPSEYFFENHSNLKFVNQFLKEIPDENSVGLIFKIGLQK